MHRYFGLIFKSGPWRAPHSNSGENWPRGPLATASRNIEKPQKWGKYKPGFWMNCRPKTALALAQHPQVPIKILILPLHAHLGRLVPHYTQGSNVRPAKIKHYMGYLAPTWPLLSFVFSNCRCGGPGGLGCSTTIHIMAK